mmetsp:Transcript_25280/g.50839  ORF Transcript_25280/g.50839 Transcript_25280/m.50839 type:complete len:215 (+) Transcript_25280:601-1245(+)
MGCGWGVGGLRTLRWTLGRRSARWVESWRRRQRCDGLGRCSAMHGPLCPSSILRVCRAQCGTCSSPPSWSSRLQRSPFRWPSTSNSVCSTPRLSTFGTFSTSRRMQSSSSIYSSTSARVTSAVACLSGTRVWSLSATSRRGSSSMPSLPSPSPLSLLWLRPTQTQTTRAIRADSRASTDCCACSSSRSSSAYSRSLAPLKSSPTSPPSTRAWPA